jgi:hypothetical protein
MRMRKCLDFWSLWAEYAQATPSVFHSNRTLKMVPAGRGLGVFNGYFFIFSY